MEHPTQTFPQKQAGEKGKGTEIHVDARGHLHPTSRHSIRPLSGDSPKFCASHPPDDSFGSFGLYKFLLRLHYVPSQKHAGLLALGTTAALHCKPQPLPLQREGQSPTF